MPAKSLSQQRLFGMALAVRKKELSRKDVDQSVLDIVDSDMSIKELEAFAKHRVHENFLSLKEYIKNSI